MASPNTCLLRLRQVHLEPRREYVVERALIPVDKKGTKVRVRLTAHGGFLIDKTTGSAVNPARRMSEADRRALGIRRNGQPRRAGRALAATTPETGKTAA